MAQEEPFWTQTCTNYLDFPTLREKFRGDLSAGREHPVTLEDVRQMAADALGFPLEQVAWFDDEISRPMLFVAGLWAAPAFPAAPQMDARLFGRVIAEGCGDAAFGPVEDPREAKAWDIIYDLPWNDPAQTIAALDKLTELYFGAKRHRESRRWTD